MKKPVFVAPDDPILETLRFVPHRSSTKRFFERFEPKPGEPDCLEVETPWGESLTAMPGDYLVSEIGAKDDRWPVKPDIFESTYEIIMPGICIKRALTYLVPLVDLTGGDPDQMVSVQSLEGVETVRAGDFYLARGVKGEIWVYPKEKIGKAMIPAQ